jgi:hypothetical protein
MARKRKAPTAGLSATSLSSGPPVIDAPELREFRELKVRLPSDIAKRIEEKSERTGIAQNRLVVDELRAAAEVTSAREFGALITEMRGTIEEMQDTLGRYAARARIADLSEDLLNAVDAVIIAEGESVGKLQAAAARLRVVRAGMRKLERAR